MSLTKQSPKRAQITGDHFIALHALKTQLDTGIHLAFSEQARVVIMVYRKGNPPD